MFPSTLGVLTLIVAISIVEAKFEYIIGNIKAVEPFTWIIAWNLTTEELLNFWSLD